MRGGCGLRVRGGRACGPRVITSAAGALAEIGGSAVEQIDRVDAETLGRWLVALARSRDRREALSGAGLERAATFSWARAARESLDIYRETAGHQRRRSPERLALQGSGALEGSDGARAFQASVRGA